MTRSERKPTRRSSSSKSSNPFAAFEFTDRDSSTENTKNAKKFGTNQANNNKTKKKKQDSFSPLSKYMFHQYFSRGAGTSKKQVDKEPIDVDAECSVEQGDGALKKEADFEPINVETEVKQIGKISRTELHCEIVDLDASGGGAAQHKLGNESEDFDTLEITERDYLSVFDTSNNGIEPNSVTLNNRRNRIGMRTPSTSVYVDLDMEGPSEEKPPVYNDCRQIDNTSSPVIIHPDLVFCGDSKYKRSRLIFSACSVKLEGSSLSGTGPTVNFEWTVNDITCIESTWCERVQTVIVNLHFKLKDSRGAGITKENLGIRGLKFAVYDPHWSDKERAIKSLGSAYQGTWHEIFDLDAEEIEDSVGSCNAMFLSGHQLTNSKDCIEVEYPEGNPEAVTIIGRDIELLQPETFINDNIIDFYIQYVKSKIPPEEEHRFYFFNCFFFKKLVGLDNNPSIVGKEREAFQSVRKWTKNVNLFEKDYIFMPVNYSLHWSLIVICHPGEVASLKDKESEKLPRIPCILHMDSIRGSHRGLRNPIQSYLCELWKEMHGTSAEVASEYPQLLFVELELPQQENSFDCGIFLLHYVERFLEEAPSNFTPFAAPESRNFLERNWFLPEEVSLKRARIRDLIYSIHESNLQKASAVDFKSKGMLHNEEAEESGMQVTEARMDTTDCEIIACTPQNLRNGGKESSQYQGFSIHHKDSDVEI